MSPSGEKREAANLSQFPEKRGRPAAIPQQNQTPKHFFIPAHFHPFTLIPVPPSDTPDDAMSGEAGPAPGWRVVADPNPRPAATVSLRTKGLTRVNGVGCSPKPGYPDRKDVPQRHTDKAPALSRTPRQRGETNGGDDGRSSMIQNIPRARVPVGLVHHPAGTSRATGQAMADTSTGGLCRSRTLRPVERRTDRRIVTTPVAALPERRMQRE